MNRKGFIALSIATASLLAATVAMRQSEQPSKLATQGAYFPALLERSNEVTKLVIKDARSTTTIVKDGDQWQVPDKGNYPAATSGIRELVLGMARLQKVEPKTREPERYHRLDLDGINEPESKSHLIQLMDVSGTPLAVVIVGKNREARGTSSRQQFYVRSPGDAQTWLVEGFLPPVDDADGWLEKSLIDPTFGEVRSVVVTSDDRSFTISRDNSDTQEFSLQGLQPEEQVGAQYSLNQVARSFIGLSFDDVRPLSDATSDSGGDASATIESFDHVQITLSVSRQDGQVLGRLRASFTGSTEPGEVIRENIDNWNDLWSKWVYVLPQYQVDGILVKREDLLVQSVDEELPAAE